MPANPTPAEGVVVPLEPMPEMLAAFWRQKNTGSQVPGETGDDRSDYAAYRAMLAARPVATTQSAAQTGEVRALEAAFKWAYARGAGTFLQDPTGDEEWRAYAKALNLSQPEPSHD